MIDDADALVRELNNGSRIPNPKRLSVGDEKIDAEKFSLLLEKSSRAKEKAVSVWCA